MANFALLSLHVWCSSRGQTPRSPRRICNQGSKCSVFSPIELLVLNENFLKLKAFFEYFFIEFICFEIELALAVFFNFFNDEKKY